ncbi:hypothetical protein [Pedobacter sp. Hv1]|uniref:hypothetical protein n=1 Tax=Pedobacter sp. Hv1 TaxID=1740090 RepID=UPI0006D8B488|nr:hypothetical protein [Pedobacter sp. Hv1]KQB99026.1 hypothetical protein AQF98_20075 [Pedobacter sp. Hv1]
MGLNPFWQEDVFLTVQDFNHQVQMLPAEPYAIIACNEHFFVHLISIVHHFTPAELIALQERFQKQGVHLVHLWEDVWLSRREQVLSRFRSFLGLNKSFHGRKAKIETVDQKQTLNFFNTYHLQGYVKAKYSYGLVADGDLIAVASFSDTRPMKSKGADYQSAELVRFASKDGLTIVGGLSKLIKHFSKQIKINDLMTYADRDWSLGKGYDKLGFNLSELTEPGILYVNTTTLIRYFKHRLPKNILTAFEAQNVLNLDDFLAENGYVKLFNTGNLKYHLYF